jgi:hypothetical protein
MLAAAADKPGLFARINQSAMLQQRLRVYGEIVLPCRTDDIGRHLLSQRPDARRRQ